jgi:hypothetical protein
VVVDDEVVMIPRWIMTWRVPRPGVMADVTIGERARWRS